MCSGRVGAVPGSGFRETVPGSVSGTRVQKVASPRFRRFRCSMGSEGIGSLPEAWTDSVLGTGVREPEVLVPKVPQVILYFESILLYSESILILLYFESVLLYFESRLVYLESILLYFESIFWYFESILLYFESMLLYFESVILYFESAFLDVESILLYFASIFLYFATMLGQRKGGN